MPETRYKETYEQGTGILIAREPYEVSNEDLAKEEDERRALEILATSPTAITMPEMWELLRIFGRQFGYLPYA